MERRIAEGGDRRTHESTNNPELATKWGGDVAGWADTPSEARTRTARYDRRPVSSCSRKRDVANTFASPGRAPLRSIQPSDIGVSSALLHCQRSRHDALPHCVGRRVREVPRVFRLSAEDGHRRCSEACRRQARRPSRKVIAGRWRDAERDSHQHRVQSTVQSTRAKVRVVAFGPANRQDPVPTSVRHRAACGTDLRGLSRRCKRQDPAPCSGTVQERQDPAPCSSLGG
jgi:hypothetical protein